MLIETSVADPDQLVRDPDPHQNVMAQQHSDAVILMLKNFSAADPDPGSGIKSLFAPWIRDGRKSASGSGINNPDHIF